METKKVYIIIINWNGKNDTLECLDSINKMGYKNYEIVVVDNGSKDDSVEVIKNKHPEVVILETGQNLGFSGGNNIGMRYALGHGADFILLLNNDTIVDSTLLDTLVNASQNGKRNGIFAPKIYYYSQPKKIWYGGVERTRDKWLFHHIGYGTSDKEVPSNSIIETEYACGCALFISADILNKIGLFDERFFLIFEETDLCFRARRIGIKSFLVPEGNVWHKASTSFGGENSPKFHYFYMRNKLLFAHKHLNITERILIYKDVFKEIARCVKPRNYRNPINRAKLLGVKDYLLKNYGNCPASI